MFRRSRLLVLLVLSLAAPAAAGAGSEDSAPTSAVRGLSKDALLQVIHANRSQVRSCYEGLIDRFPTLEGKVVIRCIISADGSASESSVDSSTVNNAELEDCVVDRVQRWAFPKPGGGIRVMFRYPYVFRQSPDPRARAAAPSRRDPSGLSAGLGFGYAAPLGSLAQANSGRTVPLSGELSGQLPIVLEAGYRFARHFTTGGCSSASGCVSGPRGLAARDRGFHRTVVAERRTETSRALRTSSVSNARDESVRGRGGRPRTGIARAGSLLHAS